MSSTQVELFKPDPVAENTRRLVLLLLEARGWLTRQVIRRLTGWDDREIRLAAEGARDEKGRQLIVRWQKGLCHRRFCSVEDMQRAGAQFKSQGRIMELAGIDLERLAHLKLAGGLDE